MSGAEPTVEIREEPSSALAEHALVSIAFEVNRVLDLVLVDRGLRGLELRERRLAKPYTKDYDAIADNAPADWARRFDVSKWGVFCARVEGRCVGCAMVAFATPELQPLPERSELAVLWDLRVSPALRGRGIGTRLFAVAEGWASARACTRLAIETQNVNVPACRFYASRGCELGSVDRFAYPAVPEEIRLIWYKDLSGGRKES